MLIIACRQLALNAEENNDYEQASGFRRMAMELIFLEKLLALKEWLKYPFKMFYIFGEARINHKKRWRRIYTHYKRKNKNPISFRQSFVVPHFFYRTLSAYSEGWGRPSGVLLVILFVSALLYTQTNFYICPPDKPITQSSQENQCETRRLNVWEASRHSLATATFQNVEYRKPVTGWGETFIILEKILAPIQVALLALAIRRKFMR